MYSRMSFNKGKIYKSVFLCTVEWLAKCAHKRGILTRQRIAVYQKCVFVRINVEF